MTTDVPDNHSAPSAARHRPKMHRIYFALAAFDVLTVVFSLYLINRITGIYTESVDVNREWADVLRDLGELRAKAAAVNAPGNDAFRQLNPDFSKAQTAWRTFDEHLKRMRTELADHVDEAMAQQLGPEFTGIDEHMMAMLAHSRDVHAAIDEQKIQVAGASMALMDTEFNEVNLGLSRLEEQVRDIQSARLAEQADAASSLKAYEILIGGLVLLMVAAVTVYGHKLAGQMRRSADELHRHREHLETLVDERTRELAESHRRLRISERLASIGTLAAGLGHDMNNVLFPARCRLEKLAAAHLDEDTDQEVEALLDSVDYLQKLSEGLRLLSLDPLDPDAASGRKTNPARWWAEVGRLFHTAVPKNCSFETQLPDDLPDLAIAPHQLTQIFFNLVLNAGDAVGPDGNIHFEAQGLEDGRSARLWVTDNGQGMTDEVKQQALDPFFTTKTRTFSTGLGLALVHSVVRTVGGSLSIDSRRDVGTTVTVVIPIALAADAATDDAHRTDSPTIMVSLADRRLGSMISSLLQQSGLPVSVGDHPSSVSIWIMEHSDAARAAMDSFLDGHADRRVIMFVDEPLTWPPTTVTQVRRSSGMQDIQDAVSTAVLQVREAGA